MTFKIGDKVRYNKAAVKSLIGEEGVFTVTGDGDYPDNFMLNDGEIIHESWLEKVEEEYGVGDIVCARKGKEIVQGALVLRSDGELGVGITTVFRPTMGSLKEQGYSIELVEKAKPVEPESSYVLFTDAKGEPFLSYKIAPDAWVTQDYEDEWADTLAAFGPEYIELVKK